MAWLYSLYFFFSSRKEKVAKKTCYTVSIVPVTVSTASPGSAV